MSMSDNMKDSIYYHYSPTYKYSVGIESVNDKFFDKDYIYLRLTYLLNRKNTKNSQRNLYFQSAISPDDLNDNFYGIHGDWETRRLFSGSDFVISSNPEMVIDRTPGDRGLSFLIGINP